MLFLELRVEVGETEREEVEGDAYAAVLSDILPCLAHVEGGVDIVDDEESVRRCGLDEEVEIMLGSL